MRFNFNGKTLGFHSQTQKLEPLTVYNTVKQESTAQYSFHYKGDALGFHSKTHNLDPPYTDW